MGTSSVSHLESTITTITQRDGTTKPALERQKSTAGAAHFALKSSDVPNDSALFLDSEGVTALVASGSSDSGDISAYSHGMMIVAPSAANTLTVFPSFDGAAFSSVPIQVYNAATNPRVTVAASALAAGLYYIDLLAVRKLRFTNSAGGTMTVTMALKA